MNTIGHRECERALMLGHLYSSEEALKVGLIDAIVPADQMQEAVAGEMKQWLSIPGWFRLILLLSFVMSFMAQVPKQWHYWHRLNQRLLWHFWRTSGSEFSGRSSDGDLLSTNQINTHYDNEHVISQHVLRHKVNKMITHLKRDSVTPPFL